MSPSEYRRWLVAQAVEKVLPHILDALNLSMILYRYRCHESIERIAEIFDLEPDMVCGALRRTRRRLANRLRNTLTVKGV